MSYRRGVNFLSEKHQLFIFERNKNLAESLLEIAAENEDFLVTLFSSQIDKRLKDELIYPDLILFNVSNDQDIRFLSSSVARYFSEAFVLLMIDLPGKRNMSNVPVFKKVHFLYKPVPINLIFGGIRDAFKEIASLKRKQITLPNGLVDIKNRMIKNSIGETTYLTDKECFIIKALADANSSPLAKTELLKKVWGYAENIETSTLETHVYRLRQKLSISLGKSDLIVFQDGGYKMILERE